MHQELNDLDRAAMCGDALRPIHDLEWTCVAPVAHEDDHVAVDGTRW
jgi:hypothetical protein